MSLFLVLVREKYPVINMAKIPAQGIAGLIFAVATLGIFFLGVPAC